MVSAEGHPSAGSQRRYSEPAVSTGPQNLQTGEAYHIEEPTGEAFTDYTQIDFAIIPGVSFDKNGNRLGRGKAIL